MLDHLRGPHLEFAMNWRPVASDSREDDDAAVDAVVVLVAVIFEVVGADAVVVVGDQ